MNNLHGWLQAVVSIAIAIIACGNQWALEFYKSRKLKKDVSIEKQLEVHADKQKKFKSFYRIFDVVRVLCVIGAAIAIYLLMIQPTPLSNKEVVSIAYDFAIIVLQITFYFIDRTQNTILANGMALLTLAKSVKSLMEATETNSTQSKQEFNKLLDQLETIQKSQGQPALKG